MSPTAYQIDPVSFTIIAGSGWTVKGGKPSELMLDLEGIPAEIAAALKAIVAAERAKKLQAPMPAKPLGLLPSGIPAFATRW
jgi:hypothetical protein